MPYTPGPWKIKSLSLHPHHSIETEEREMVCYMVDHTADAADNARLIAQAPAMLKSLEDLTEWLRSNTGPKDGSHEMLIRAVEIIKAAGGTIR